MNAPRIFAAAFAALVAAPAFAATVNIPDFATAPISCSADPFDFITMNNGSTAQLPDANSCPNHLLIFKKADQTSGVDTIVPENGELIDYAPDRELQITGDGVSLFSDGTMWRSTAQPRKNLPYSHRTVTPDATRFGGYQIPDWCVSDAELIRIDADNSPWGGIGVYLPPAKQTCGSAQADTYINTGVMEFKNVSTQMNEMVSLWPNGLADPLDGQRCALLLGPEEYVKLYDDGEQLFIIGWYSPYNRAPVRAYCLS